MFDPNELLWTIVWIMVIGVAALIIGYIISRQIRKRLANSGRETAFTLQDLRDLRAAGSITEVEYEAMRAALLGAPARVPGPPPLRETPSGTGNKPATDENDEETDDLAAGDRDD